MPTLDEQLVEIQNKINTINTLKAKREVVLAQIASYTNPEEFINHPLSNLLLSDEDKGILANEIVAKLNVVLAEVESELATAIGAGV